MGWGSPREVDSQVSPASTPPAPAPEKALEKKVQVLAVEYRHYTNGAPTAATADTIPGGLLQARILTTHPTFIPPISHNPQSPVALFPFPKWAY